MIDDHAHPFALEPGPFDPTAISLDVLEDGRLDERRQVLGPTRLVQELLTVRLARRLGCDPAEVAEARAEAAKDWPAYVSSLFLEASITGVILDTGLDEGDPAGVAGRCAEVSDAAMYPIHRIDPAVDRLIEAGATASEILGSIEEDMRAAAEAGATGFCSSSATSGTITD